MLRHPKYFAIKSVACHEAFEVHDTYPEKYAVKPSIGSHFNGPQYIFGEIKFIMYMDQIQIKNMIRIAYGKKCQIMQISKLQKNQKN